MTSVCPAFLCQYTSAGCPGKHRSRDKVFCRARLVRPISVERSSRETRRNPNPGSRRLSKQIHPTSENLLFVLRVEREDEGSPRVERMRVWRRDRADAPSKGKLSLEMNRSSKPRCGLLPNEPALFHVVLGEGSFMGSQPMNRPCQKKVWKTYPLVLTPPKRRPRLFGRVELASNCRSPSAFRPERTNW